jgi:hypothetical protein
LFSLSTDHNVHHDDEAEVAHNLEDVEKTNDTVSEAEVNKVLERARSHKLRSESLLRLVQEPNRVDTDTSRQSKSDGHARDTEVFNNYWN